MKKVVEKAIQEVAKKHGINEREVQQQIELVYKMRINKDKYEEMPSANEIVMKLARIVVERIGGST